MKISKDQFFAAGSQAKVSQEQITTFWQELEKTTSASTPFTEYLFYLGGMIIISAMTWFMNAGWEQFGGGGIFLIAVLYALFFTLMGKTLWNKNHLRIPAGLFITIAVCMTPLAIYGLQTYFSTTLPDHPYKGFYEWIADQWVLMEIGTILAGIIALRFFPSPFLTAPIFFAAWYLTMDIVPLIFGKEFSLQEKCGLSLCFGLLLLGISFMIDRKKTSDYAFWSYFFGTITFWGGLTCMLMDKGEMHSFIYLLINVALMCLSILVRRNVLMIFGALGMFVYLSHLANYLFADSILFPFVLSLVGLLIIYFGYLYQKNLEWIKKKINEKIPSRIRNFLDHSNEG
jgi:hypothetical protein